MNIRTLGRLMSLVGLVLFVTGLLRWSRSQRSGKPSGFTEGYRDWVAERKRARSLEAHFGFRWRFAPRPEVPRWRVSWIEATGELYAANPVLDRYIVLGQYATRGSVEQAMSGWDEGGPTSLWEWFGVQ